jgi:plastocyanin
MRRLFERLLYIVVLSVMALLTFMPFAEAQEDAGVVAVPVLNARSVYIQNYFFDPANAAVEPGSTITWINKGDDPHTVTADDGPFDSGVLNPGDSYTVAFDGQGTLTYHCMIHPEMSGSVTVGGGGGGVPVEQPSEQPAGEDMSGGMGGESGY